MITPEIDLFAIFIFFGAVQGLALAIYNIVKMPGERLSNYLLAFLLICFSIILLDIFGGYTGYIIHYIYLNNISDPLVFLLGPLCLLYTYAQTKDYLNIQPRHYAHFIIPIFIFIYMMLYFVQPDGLKYNDFLSSFHPEIEKDIISPIFEYDPFGILKFIAELMIIHMSVYLVLSIRLINKILKVEGTSFFSFTSSTLAWLRILLSGFIFALVIFIFIKIFFYNDLGIHIIATYISILIYSISIYVIKKNYFDDEDEDY